MKNKLTGWTIIIIGTILFFRAWDIYSDIWYLLTETHDHLLTTDYLIIIGQGVTYLTLFSISILFGVSLTRGTQKNIKIKRLAFLTVLTIWILLEIPIYNCDFGQSRHSFWA